MWSEERGITCVCVCSDQNSSRKGRMKARNVVKRRKEQRLEEKREENECACAWVCMYESVLIRTAAG